ncbi:MAG TPA: hypothetical protein VHT91_11960 [Kofleriaceae bacterium]|nr:hypothetical protein [Kofleriaceae bacterium]
MTDDRPPTELPEPSDGRDLPANLGQAVDVLRAREAWPEHDTKALAIAWQQVASHASNDPRLLEDLARACSAGAAAWWERKPMRHRIAPATWRLETAPDERERCMFVGDGERCEHRPEWRIGSVAELDYAYLCGAHLDLVRQPGQLAEVIEQPG